MMSDYMAAGAVDVFAKESRACPSVGVQRFVFEIEQ